MIKDLAVQHSYYCHDSNWCDREARRDFDTWRDFIAQYADADIDMNLVFRWDIIVGDEEDYSLMIYQMQQRRGRFVPIEIHEVTDADEESIRLYLSTHWNHLMKLWQPISPPTQDQPPI